MDDCTRRGVLEAAHDEYEAMLAMEAVPDGIEEHRGAQYMRDGKGGLTPIETIRPSRLLQDQTARRLIAKAKRVSRQVQAFRAEMLSDIDTFVGIVRENYDASRGHGKGNVCLMTVDQLFKVERTIGEFIDFGPELDAAKVLVTECLQEWTEGASANLRAIVERAFQTDKKGKIRRNDLLNLLTLDIEDARWKQAMVALKDSIIQRGTKEYVRFYERANPRDKWRAIAIDLASDIGEAA